MSSAARLNGERSFKDLGSALGGFVSAVFEEPSQPRENLDDLLRRADVLIAVGERVDEQLRKGPPAFTQRDHVVNSLHVVEWVVRTMSRSRQVIPDLMGDAAEIAETRALDDLVASFRERQEHIRELLDRVVVNGREAATALEDQIDLMEMDEAYAEQGDEPPVDWDEFKTTLPS